MTSPQPNVPCVKQDGVCFAFNLAVPSQMPAKICISKRPSTGGTWIPIGKLTDFATLSGVRTVRGPAVWIPDATGDFEVKAEAFNSAVPPQILCSATRQISIVANSPPVISIVTGPTNANQNMVFTTTWSDADFGDEVTRVEFYDYGTLIGTDRKGPVFGDAVEDIDGVADLHPNLLLTGPHQITAKAYDTRGSVGTTASPYSVTITAGNNYRPAFTSISTGSVIIPKGYDDYYLLTFNASDQGGSLTRLEANPVAYSGTAGPSALLDDVPIGNSFWLGDLFSDTGLYTLRVFVEDNHTVNSVPTPARSYERFLKVRVTGPGYDTAQHLANAIDDGTTAVAANNADFSGIERSGGFGANGIFSNTPGRLDMPSGVLLTTGQYYVWDDGNTNTNMQNKWGTPGDTVLEDKITRSITHDAATLEFDVDCVNSQLECEVQFGSEEFPEYFHPGGYHDAFAVTVDGVLISLVPDGGATIGAHSVHPFIPAPGVLQLPNDLDALRDYLYVNNPSPTSVEYDGLTMRLRLHAFVTPGIHRVRFSIADTDYPEDNTHGGVDSALFIKAGSLRTINPSLP